MGEYSKSNESRGSRDFWVLREKIPHSPVKLDIEANPNSVKSKSKPRDSSPHQTFQSQALETPKVLRIKRPVHTERKHRPYHSESKQ